MKSQMPQTDPGLDLARCVTEVRINASQLKAAKIERSADPDLKVIAEVLRSERKKTTTKKSIDTRTAKRLAGLG